MSLMWQDGRRTVTGIDFANGGWPEGVPPPVHSPQYDAWRRQKGAAPPARPVLAGNANLDLLSRTGQLDFRQEAGGLKGYHKDPYGDQIRRLAGGSGFTDAEQRMIDRSARRQDLMRAMNPSTPGNSTWLPGYGYVPSDSPAVQKIQQDMDLERQRMELEREKLAMEREQMNRQIGLGADLRGWLSKRLGGAE